MNSPLLVALLFALGGGALIGLQANFVTLSSRTIGPLSTGTIAMIGGGIIGIVALAVLIQMGNFSPSEASRRDILLPLMSGMMGLFIMSGTAFALSTIGLATGFVTILLGQMIIGVVVDTLGLSGGEALPLSGQRILGLVVLGVAIFLLIPKE